MDPLISPSEADIIISQSIAALTCEEVDFLQAQGRTLRKSLHADRDFPPYDRATMDGIACRQRDLAMGPLTIQGLHPAGAPAPGTLRPGHCWRIMTGSIFPTDCDTLIPVEDLSGEGKLVSALPNARATEGAFIHRQGSDCRTGTLLLESGAVLNASHLGLAATLGETLLTVNRQPHIAVISTGDELVPPHETPLPHQLRQSNGPTLLALLRGLSISEDQVEWQHLSDERRPIEQALSKAIASKDVILISGGISMGAKDLIRPVLEDLLGPPAFHGIAQRPGKPLAYWEAGDSTPPVFALPGNPNSTFMTFLRYVRPALRQLAGSAIESPITLALATAEERHHQLTLLLPARLQPNGQLAVIRPQNSGDLMSPRLATGFVEIPPGQGSTIAAAYRSY